MYRSDHIYHEQLFWSILLLGAAFLTSMGQAQPLDPSDWHHAATHDEGFFAPDEFRLIGDGPPTSALVLDHQSPDQALARLRLEDGSPIGHTVQTGQGPGEVSGQGMRMSRFSDGKVLLWDGGQRQAYVYDADLRFVGQIKGMDDVPADPAALVNDSTLATVVSVPSGDLFRLYRLHSGPESLRIAEEPLVTLETSEHQQLNHEQLDENIMIRQGLPHRAGDELYYGFTFGSLVVGMDEEGLRWATTDPVDHTLPVYGFQDGNAVVAPSLDEVPKGVLDLAVDESHLYVLYSGQKIGNGGGLLNTLTGADIGEQIEAINHSDRLFAFDRTSGEFIAEVRLPIRAKGIEMTEQYVMLHVTEERKAPSFEVYRRTPASTDSR